MTTLTDLFEIVPPLSPATDRPALAPPSIEGDPLSDEQKANMLRFVSERAFAAMEEWKAKVPDPIWKAAKGKDDSFRSVLLAPLSVENARAFSLFLRALENPLAVEELGLTRLKERGPAQIYLRTVLKQFFLEEAVPTAEKVQRAYFERVTGSRRLGHDCPRISEKYAMLFNDDTVIERGTSTDTVDILLSHTHFMTQPGIPRERTRALIRDAFLELARNAETKHILDALAAAFLAGKGRIFIGDDTAQIGTLGRVYYHNGEERRGVGGTCTSHSIFIPALSERTEERTIAQANLLHESLHFLFNELVENRHSPVIDGTTEADLLDEALASDRDHRRNRRDERNIDMLMKRYLEEGSLYFPGGFDPAKLEHLHLMRVESIVRIMQAQYLGDSPFYIGTAAPKLYAFYTEHSRPLLEAYTIAMRAKHTATPPTQDELRHIWKYLKDVLFVDNPELQTLMRSLENGKRGVPLDYVKMLKELTSYFRRQGISVPEEVILDPMAYRKMQKQVDDALLAAWPRIAAELRDHRVPIMSCSSAKEIRAFLKELPRSTLNKVKSINLGGLNLTVIPPEINLFTQLKFLDLSNNRLSKFDRLQLPSLECLLAHGNLNDTRPSLPGLPVLKTLTWTSPSSAPGAFEVYEAPTRPTRIAAALGACSEAAVRVARAIAPFAVFLARPSIPSAALRG